MKLTDETVKKLEEAFAIDASIPEACYYADISKQTYYNWIEANPDLKEKFDRLREKPVLKARQTVVGNLDNPEMALRYLERKRKAEFSVRQELEHSTPPDKQFNVNISTINGDKLATDNQAK
jgi:hypothetical protein